MKNVVLKRGRRTHPIQIEGLWVRAVYADDVDHLLLQWIDSCYNGTFKIEAESKSHSIRFPINECGLKTKVQCKMVLQQFPVLCNHATTGHKLQGKSVKELVIAEWSKVKNWAYVVLSRVKTMSGLYLTSPIPDDIDFSLPESYIDMMNDFCSNILCTREQIANLWHTIN